MHYLEGPQPVLCLFWPEVQSNSRLVRARSGPEFLLRMANFAIQVSTGCNWHVVD